MVFYPNSGDLIKNWLVVSSLRKRSKGRFYLVCKTNPRFKVRQGQAKMKKTINIKSLAYPLLVPPGL